MSRRSDGRAVRHAPALLALLLLAGCQADGGQPPSREAPRGPPGFPAEMPQGMVDLAPLGYDLGNPEAPVTVVEFSDFGCPYCAGFALETFPVLLAEYVESGLVRWKYVPFVLGIFPNGAEAARAAECVADQGRFWQMHDLLYARQREWKASDAPAELFLSLATEVGVDPVRFSACYRVAGGAARTEANNVAAEALHVRATPSFLVNGQPVQGALPLEHFRSVLEQAGAAR